MNKFPTNYIKKCRVYIFFKKMIFNILLQKNIIKKKILDLVFSPQDTICDGFSPVMVKRIGLDLCLRDLNPCSAIHQLCNLVQVIYPLNLSLLVYKMEIIIFIFWVEEEITCKALSIVPNKAHKHNAYIVQSILIICFLF